MMPFGPAPYLKMLTVPESVLDQPDRLLQHTQSAGAAVPKMKPIMHPTARVGKCQLFAMRG
jgi:hypothetical protein